MAKDQRTSDDTETMEALLTSDDVAKLLGLATKTLAEWRSKGKGPPFVRLRRSIRYRSADIKAYLAENIVYGDNTGKSSSRPDSAGKNRSHGKKGACEKIGKAKQEKSRRKKAKKKPKW